MQPAKPKNTSSMKRKRMHKKKREKVVSSARQARSNVQELSQQIESTKRRDFQFMSDLKASLEKNLTQQRHRVAHLEAKNAKVSESINVLKHRVQVLRGAATEQQEKNEKMRKDLNELSDNMSIVEEFAAQALIKDQNKSGAPELQILAELRDEDAKRRAEAEHMRLVAKISPSTRSSSLLELGSNVRAKRWWGADAFAWLKGSGKAIAEASVPQADKDEAVAQQPGTNVNATGSAWEALHSLTTALDQLAEARKNSEASLRAAFMQEYTSEHSKELELLSEQKLLKEQAKQLEDRVHRVTVALTKLEEVGNAINVRRQQVLGFASRVVRDGAAV